MTIAQLKRLRWTVRGVLTLGVVASVAANILHAQSNPISQTIAAWPPLALLLTVELVSRVPVHKRSLAGIRFVATATIAGIAAWVSYWHMQGVGERYGEAENSYLIPITVDGLIVVASVSLVELAGRIRSLEEPPAPTLRIPAAPAAAEVVAAVEESVSVVAPQSPAVPVEIPAGAPIRRRRPSGRSGIQMEPRPSKPGLSGGPLMEEPPVTR